MKACLFGLGAFPLAALIVLFANGAALALLDTITPPSNTLAPGAAGFYFRLLPVAAPFVILAFVLPAYLLIGLPSWAVLHACKISSEKPVMGIAGGAALVAHLSLAASLFAGASAVYQESRLLLVICSVFAAWVFAVTARRMWRIAYSAPQEETVS